MRKKQEQKINSTTEETNEQQDPDRNVTMEPAGWFIKRKFARTHTVYQMEISECGTASLSMVMQYYGVYVSPELLRVQTGVSRNGVNAKNICVAANTNGFIANGYKRETDSLLAKTAMPCIIHWDFRHFVVLEGYRFGKFYINDPGMGRRHMSREEFEEHFTGIVLEIIPTDNIVKQKKPNSLFRFGQIRLNGQGKYLFAMFMMGICMILPGAVTPALERVFMDNVLGLGENKTLKWIFLGIILITIYNAYFSVIKKKFTDRFSYKMQMQSSDGLLEHLFRLPLDFFEQRMSGDLVQRIDNDARVSQFLSGELISIVISQITALVYLGIMLLYDVKLALLGFSFSLVSLIAVILTSKKNADYAQQMGVDGAKLVGSAYNGITVSSSIKAAGAENMYSAKVLGYSALVQVSDQRMGEIQYKLDVIPDAIASISNVVVLIAGSKLIIDGKFTPGLLMAFTGFLSSFTGPFSGIAGFAREIQVMKNDMMRVEDLLHYEEDEMFISEGSRNAFEEGDKLKGDVELRDISFAYGSLDKPLIRKFNFKLEKGKTVALVGSSGCGKSTVAKLITSMYKPWTGQVLFDGIPSDSIPRSVLTNSIAVVDQQIVIFEGSIYDNITTWNDSITQEAVIRAAKDACIHDDIILKSGAYDYQLTIGGTNVSGGQRQRIEIAKALATDPAILVLDEATSFLDTLTEKKIYQNIKNRGCTCVIVAQRLSSIRDCDEIIVMKNGRIIERGKHEELMNQKGSYYELAAKSIN